MCTWGERTQSRWIHPACLECPSTVETITPLGASTQRQVAAARAPLRTEAASLVTQTSDQGSDNAFEDTARACWAEGALPNPEWWQGLSWSAAVEGGQTTFVQIPDRFRGAAGSSYQLPHLHNIDATLCG